MSALCASVETAGGIPLVILSGVADSSTIPYLIEAINDQLLQGVLHVTLDVSRMLLADATAIWLLLLIARFLKAQGGRLVLLSPQAAVAGAVMAADPDGLIAIGQSTSL